MFESLSLSVSGEHWFLEIEHNKISEKFDLKANKNPNSRGEEKISRPRNFSSIIKYQKNSMNLQAVSCSFGFVSSPLGVTPRTSFRRFVIRAKTEPSEKSVEIMRKFSEQYARRSGTYFCVDKGVTSVVIKGLAEHKDSYGAPLCPCRHYDDKAAEVGQGFWNCPCVPMRERKECHCMLFLTPDNDFAGKDQTITSDEIKETTANM